MGAEDSSAPVKVTAIGSAEQAEEEAADFEDPMAMLGGMGAEDSSAPVKVTAIGSAAQADEESADIDDPMAMLGGMGAEDSSAPVKVTAIGAANNATIDARTGALTIEEKPAEDPEAEKARKRAEIMAKVAAAQALREKEAKAAAAREAKKKEIEENGTSYY